MSELTDYMFDSRMKDKVILILRETLETNDLTEEEIETVSGYAKELVQNVETAIAENPDNVTKVLYNLLDVAIGNYGMAVRLHKNKN
jgi:hypothetical protein